MYCRVDEGNADSHSVLFEQCPFSLFSLLPSLIRVGELMKVRKGEGIVILIFAERRVV